MAPVLHSLKFSSGDEKWKVDFVYVAGNVKIDTKNRCVWMSNCDKDDITFTIIINKIDRRQIKKMFTGFHEGETCYVLEQRLKAVAFVLPIVGGSDAGRIDASRTRAVDISGDSTTIHLTLKSGKISVFTLFEASNVHKGFTYTRLVGTSDAIRRAAEICDSQPFQQSVRNEFDHNRDFADGEHFFGMFWRTTTQSALNMERFVREDSEITAACHVYLNVVNVRDFNDEVSDWFFLFLGKIIFCLAFLRIFSE